MSSEGVPSPTQNFRKPPAESRVAHRRGRQRTLRGRENRLSPGQKARETSAEPPAERQLAHRRVRQRTRRSAENRKLSQTRPTAFRAPTSPSAAADALFDPERRSPNGGGALPFPKEGLFWTKSSHLLGTWSFSLTPIFLPHRPRKTKTHRIRGVTPSYYHGFCLFTYSTLA